MTPVEIMALILIAVSAVKIIVILIKPSAWMNGVVKKVWAKPMLAMVISLILAGIALYYLLQELTIVQILAATLFVALLMAVGIGIYSKEMLSAAGKLMKQGIVKKSWLYIIIWIILLGWGAKELFM